MSFFAEVTCIILAQPQVDFANHEPYNSKESEHDALRANAVGRVVSKPCAVTIDYP